MANPRVHAPVPQGNFLAVVPSRSQDPLDWDVPFRTEKVSEEQTTPGARRYRRRRFLWWLRWTVEATGATPGRTAELWGDPLPPKAPHGAQRKLTGWSDGNAPDPWDYDGSIPGRRTARQC